MGKALIIKGADFSANAIERILPASYDYEVFGCYENGGMLANSGVQDGDYIILGNADKVGKVVQYGTGGYITPYDLEDGDILKITDNLYGVYSSADSDFNYITENENDVTPAIGSTIYNYDSTNNTFTPGTNPGRQGATMNVLAGDIVIFKGTGGSGARLMAIANGTTIERISPSGAQVVSTLAFEVKSNGTLYANFSGSSYKLKVLRL